MEPLAVITPEEPVSPRFAQALARALAGRSSESLHTLPETLTGRRILFAVPLEQGGVSRWLCGLLAALRTRPGCLSGSVGGILVGGDSDLYTKDAGRSLMLAANLAGCAFPGRALVEGTGSLQNFTVLARNGGCTLKEAYRLAAADLVSRLAAFAPPRYRRPKLLVLHASSRATSNTLALWSRVRRQVEGACDITEIGLRNGTLEDCSGCPYTLCLHYGEQGDCFYGGVMVREVYPALRAADAVMLLCPNYNDALSANLTACINRLTALYRVVSFDEKAVFAIVVSGYSGGDLVASQLAGALSINKGFWLPPQFCLLETANDAGTALALPGIDDRLNAFSQGMLARLAP